MIFSSTYWALWQSEYNTKQSIYIYIDLYIHIYTYIFHIYVYIQINIKNNIILKTN